MVLQSKQFQVIITIQKETMAIIMMANGIQPLDLEVVRANRTTSTTDNGILVEIDSKKKFFACNAQYITPVGAVLQISLPRKLEQLTLTPAPYVGVQPRAVG